MLDKIIEWFPEEEILKADGFDNAIIGIDDIINIKKSFESHL